MWLMQRTGRRAAGLAVVGAAGIALAAFAGMSTAAPDRREQPAAFVSRVLRLIVADDYGAAWNDLFTTHKRVAPKREYVACESLTPVGGKVGAIHVVRVVDRVLRVPGQAKRLPGKAVTLRVEMLGPAFTSSSSFTHTFSAVRQGEGWAWMLTRARYELYRTNACV
jgi:hypothetical protein